MDPITEKRAAFDAAKKLLAQKDDSLLRYVALELRRCLESVVYEKLWAYRRRIAAKVARKWQPPQAFRALLIMEPDADKSSVIRFAPEATPGGPVTAPFEILGVDRRPSSAWLNKTYNKLGSLLHAEWPYARERHTPEPSEKRRYLEQTVLKLEPFVVRSFTSTLATVVEFTCSVCNQPIIANAAGLEKRTELFCLDP